MRLRHSIWIAALAMAATAAAQTADRRRPATAGSVTFLGKWRMVADSFPPLTFTRNGDDIEGTVAGRSYKFRLDGRDYATPDEGQTASWRRTGDRTYETVLKRNGQVISTTTAEMSPDGKTVQLLPVNVVLTRRSAYDPAEPLLGGWEMIAPVVVIDTAPNGYHWTGAGTEYTAAFDGREYPVTGEPNAMVTLKKIDERTFEETRKANGAVVTLTRFELSEDGGTITRTLTNLKSSNPAPIVTKWVRENP